MKNAIGLALVLIGAMVVDSTLIGAVIIAGMGIFMMREVLDV